MKPLKELFVFIIAITSLFITRDIYLNVTTQFFNSEIISGEIATILSYITPILIIYIAHKTVVPINIDRNKKLDMETTSYEATAMLLIGGIFSFIMIILMRFIDNDNITAGNNMTDYSGSTLPEILTLLFAAAIVGPIVEEILFRGILLGALRQIIDIKSAVLATSLVFGLLHRTSIMMVLAATVSGIVLACIYLYHKNIMNSIIVHMLFNFIATLSAIRPKFPIEISELLQKADGPITILIGLVLAGYFVYLSFFIVIKLKGKYSERRI